MSHRHTVYLLILALFCGCSSYPGVGMFADGHEVFIGELTPKLDKDVRLFVGENRFSIRGETTGTWCQGRISVTTVPALTSPGSNQCQGQKGEVFASCTDDRSLKGHWSAVSCKVGYGQGEDTNGTLFAFTFGLPEDRAKSRLESTLGISTGRSIVSDTDQRR